MECKLLPILCMVVTTVRLMTCHEQVSLEWLNGLTQTDIH